MVIVQVVYQSSSQVPPAAAHARYIARDGQYARRGGVELVESGNMPEFAPGGVSLLLGRRRYLRTRQWPRVSRDTDCPPRKLGKGEREKLAREVMRELMGERFACTMAFRFRWQMTTPHGPATTAGPASLHQALSPAHQRQDRTFHPDRTQRWAYARSYQNLLERHEQLAPWIYDYNFHRQHASLNHNTPASRSGLNRNNLLSLHM